jgi:hypothetical protein
MEAEMIEAFIKQCKDAEKEIWGYYQKIESPTLRLAAWVLSVLIFLSLFFAFMPWTLLLSIGILLWIIYGKHDTTKGP